MVRTTGTVELAPTATFPNEASEGEAMMPSLAAPVPPSPSLRSEFDALLVNVTSPCTHPVAVGENVTLSAVLCPADKVSGNPGWERVNSAPLRLIADTVTLAVPPLVKITTWVSACPV